MGRSLSDARRWMQQGTSLLTAHSDLGGDALSAPSGLPGWSRKHLLAHVSANADALGNLIRWAATGKPTPMYRTPEERVAGIELGSRLSAAQLWEWLHRSAKALEGAMARLSDEQWREPVVTAQGRTVPAAECPGCEHAKYSSTPSIWRAGCHLPTFRPTSYPRCAMKWPPSGAMARDRP
jgi:maleylpyruvate isomerase